MWMREGGEIIEDSCYRLRKNKEKES